MQRDGKQIVFPAADISGSFVNVRQASGKRFTFRGTLSLSRIHSVNDEMELLFAILICMVVQRNFPASKYPSIEK
jgi:hypothetical protein